MLSRLALHTHNKSVFHEIICLIEIGSIGEQLQRENICVHSLGLTGFWKTPIALLRMWKILRASNAQIVHTWMYHSDFLGGLIARWLVRRPVIWAIRNTKLPTHSVTTRVLARVNARLSKWIPSKIVYCANAARRYHEAMGYSPALGLVIPNAYSTQKRERGGFDVNLSSSNSEPSDEALVIGCVGRFDSLKNYPMMVNAFKLVADQHPQVQFLMVGRGVEKSNPKFYALVKQAKLEARCTCVGETTNVESYLAKMDIFCLSSTSEGFPNVVAEAMTMELPCVVTDVGDAALIVGNTGTVVPSGDARLFSEAIIKLIRTPASSRIKLGALARERIADHYSIQSVCSQYVKLYSALVDSKQSKMMKKND
jgi:glycosyltransferase involved in cell wall biosynthesis